MRQPSSFAQHVGRLIVMAAPHTPPACHLRSRVIERNAYNGWPCTISSTTVFSPRGDSILYPHMLHLFFQVFGLQVRVTARRVDFVESRWHIILCNAIPSLWAQCTRPGTEPSMLLVCRIVLPFLHCLRRRCEVSECFVSNSNEVRIVAICHGFDQNSHPPISTYSYNFRQHTA